MQNAAALQAKLLTNTEDSAAVKVAGFNSARALNCVVLKFNPANDSTNLAWLIVREEARSLTTNTKARLKAYLAFDRAMDGGVISMLEGNTCE